MQQYLEFLRTIRNQGVEKQDRTGVGIRSFFSYEMRFDLAKGFPLLTTKKLHWKSIVLSFCGFYAAILISSTCRKTV